MSTVKQTDTPQKTKKRKVASGAEVITGDEVIRRITEKNNLVKSTVSKRMQTPGKNPRKDLINHDISEEDKEEEENAKQIIFDDSDDDIEEEMREAQELDLCMEEISKSPEDIMKDDWVLIGLAGKRSKKHYVGQVVRVNWKDDELEVRFTRKVPTLDPLSSSTFSWKDPDECAIVSTQDVISSLPRPAMNGRRNLIKFEITFSAYNMQ